ncbi:hypothetical protein [Zoogloea sp.]|uniref:hypothetical protein n=1 Tax=Zoogloea sp. TaxID=49181 RepID=UPI00262CCA35|nr:hypothetical protein [Zoogloea sp.]MDD3353378.1 hypothetical protein [Zoogloea sp.]
MPHLALFALALVVLPAGAHSSPGGSVFCCSDNGRQVCGDVLPAQCFGKAYREMSPQGTLRRIVEAPLTPEQLARREEEEQLRRAELARQKAEQRRNQSLLATYSSVADIDARRDRAIESVQSEVKQAETAKAELMKKRGALVREAEFYQKRVLPAALASAIRESDSALAAQDLVIEAKRKDIESIRARYAQDRSRYIELTQTRLR